MYRRWYVHSAITYLPEKEDIGRWWSTTGALGAMAGMLTAGVVNVFAGAPTEAGGGADWPWGRAKMSSTTAVAISSAAAAASEAPEYHQYYLVNKSGKLCLNIHVLLYRHSVTQIIVINIVLPNQTNL